MRINTLLALLCPQGEPMKALKVCLQSGEIGRTRAFFLIFLKTKCLVFIRFSKVSLKQPRPSRASDLLLRLLTVLAILINRGRRASQPASAVGSAVPGSLRVAAWSALSPTPTFSSPQFVWSWRVFRSCGLDLYVTQALAQLFFSVSALTPPGGL